MPAAFSNIAALVWVRVHLASLTQMIRCTFSEQIEPPDGDAYFF
jgi:hypothetical protein